MFVSFQYYYNSHTQQYMYWDGEKRTYVPAPSQTEGAGADSTSLDASVGKDKKDKPKTKTAQQVDIHTYIQCCDASSVF